MSVKLPFEDKVLQQVLLDRARLEERCEVHFAGQMGLVPDVLRACIQVTTIEQLQKLIDLAAGDRFRIGDSNPEILGVINRFAEPAWNDYRDLKVRVRVSETVSCTMRIVHAGMNEAQQASATHYGEMLALAALGHLRARQIETFFVVISDNFNHCDDRSLTLVHGFQEFAQAKFYAVSRFQDYLRRLSIRCEDSHELLLSWRHLGEEMVVASSGPEDDIYLTSDELMGHLVEGPALKGSDWQRDWADYPLSTEGLDRALRDLVTSIEAQIQVDEPGPELGGRRDPS